MLSCSQLATDGKEKRPQLLYFSSETRPTHLQVQFTNNSQFHKIGIFFNIVKICNIFQIHNIVKFPNICKIPNICLQDLPNTSLNPFHQHLPIPQYFHVYQYLQNQTIFTNSQKFSFFPNSCKFYNIWQMEIIVYGCNCKL